MNPDHDQASLINSLKATHLLAHGGKPSEECQFCNNFILNTPNGPGIISHSFIIIDVSKKDNKKSV